MPASNDAHLPNFLDVAARAHPHGVALTFGAEHWTFAELQRAVYAASRELARLNPDGRVGVLAANGPGFVIAVHAAARLGLPIVPLNWRQTAAEIAWQVRQAEVTLLLTDAVRATIARTACEGRAVEIVQLEALERSGAVPGRVPPAPPVDLGQDAALLFTSGTSGTPKGARITYGNLWHSAVASALHLGHTAADVWLAAMPLFHIGGLSILYRSVIGASRIVLQERFEPQSALAALEDGVTLASLVPTMLQQMIEMHGDLPWPASPRAILLGGAASPPSLIEECIARGIPAAPTYGLTEASSQVTTLNPRHLARKPRSSGLPLPSTRVRVVEDGAVVEPGALGEIEFSGPTRFAGYLGDKPRCLGGDEWFATGDSGYLDDEGYLYVVDRRADLIVSGGENIYPAEIERALLDHPSVHDAGVVGVPDERWGARPVAFLVWEGDPADAEPLLRAHCRARLAGYKVPDRFVLVPELPRTASGKLRRGALRSSLSSGSPSLA